MAAVPALRVQMHSASSSVEMNYKMYLNMAQWHKATATGTILQNIPIVINCARCGDTEAVAKALEQISQSIQDMTDALKLMQGR